MTLTTKARFRIVLTTASCWLLVGTCAAGIAETFEVTNGNDAGPGSLRDAVAQAQVSPSDNRNPDGRKLLYLRCSGVGDDDRCRAVVSHPVGDEPRHGIEPERPGIA